MLVLPGTVLVLIPLLILWATHGTNFAATPAGPKSMSFWLAVLFAIPGATLSIRSMSVFFRFGDGTAAPWDPPQRLVVVGPYRHVRNPMLVGVIAMLIAESLLLQSSPLGIWVAVFSIGNAIYFPLVEEPGLLARFGDDYRVYSQHVGRWIPRLSPWQHPQLTRPSNTRNSEP